jgi:hypothetical protein
MGNPRVFLLALAVLFLAACRPNLVVRGARIDFAAKTVSFTEKNIGRTAAGGHVTTVEISRPSAAAPGSRYKADVPGIPAGGTWSSGPIPFTFFSSARGLDLFGLTAARLVVRADATDVVREANEGDNVYRADR